MTCPVGASGLRPIPCDFVANETALNIATVLTSIAMVPFLLWVIWETRRTRSLLLPWLLASGALCTVLTEPIADITGGIYLPAEAPVTLFTVLGRPMPLVDLYIWTLMAMAFYWAYRLMKRGAPVRTVWTLAAILMVIEVIGEMAGALTNSMLYHSNHALIAGVPIYTIAQNLGITVVGGAALVLLQPHLHGWRWLASITFVPSVMLAYAFATTVPGYIAVHTDVSPAIGWALGLTAAALNLLVAHAALHIEPIARLRSENVSPDTGFAAAARTV